MAVSEKRRRRSSDSSTDVICKKAKLSMLCCLKQCCMPTRLITTEQQCRVEIRAAAMPNTDLASFLQDSAVLWDTSGEATFHEQCWANLLKDTRRRKLKNANIPISPVEKTLIKDAAKTVERYDSAAFICKASSQIVALMNKSKHCVVFTGAGISTSAGIGDYRGKAGKWTEMDQQEVTIQVGSMIKTSEKAVESEKEVTKNECSSKEEEGVPYEKLRPTFTHEALVKLMELGKIKYIISQNGDGLHGLSGVNAQHLAEVHGNVFLELCEKCGHRYYRPFYVIDDIAGQYFEELEENGSTELQKAKHALRCKQCGLNHRTGRRCEVKGCKGFLKDSIINFGDNLDASILSAAEEQARQADLIISLGTTMKVTPACELVLVGREPLHLVIVNRQCTEFDEICEKKDQSGEGLGVRVFGDCDKVLQEVMMLLLSKEEREIWHLQKNERKANYERCRNSN